MGICCRRQENQSIPNPVSAKGRPNLQINIPTVKQQEKESREIVDLALQRRALKKMKKQHLQIDQSPLFQKRKSLKLNMSFEYNALQLTPDREVKSAKPRRHQKFKKIFKEATKDSSKETSVGVITP